ncbi:MAG: murein biosynthesis integral membrane protein MurJ [Planctomycetota bacterium]|nr:murein biosynthesis integral membrane protein MurJ [Planctomycetota bacterium]MDA1211211.1 murein biosynthesis integral membrane protein MurJ [Planctomycetota bacterium]
MNDSPNDTADTTRKEPSRRHWLGGLRVVGMWTLFSRVLGLFRDIGMAVLFGNGAVMDAFSVAFRIPNLARRLFGEGALTTAFLPAFIKELQESGTASAWRLANAIFVLLTIGLTAVVLVGEIALAIWNWGFDVSPETRLLIELTAVMLPYLLCICLAAQVSAVLHAFQRFAWPAFVPVVLNLAWLGAIGLIFLFPESFGPPATQVRIVSIAIVFAGVLQLGVQLPTLRRLGFRYDREWTSAKREVMQVGERMLPIVIGLSIIQFNTLCDGLIAWGFSAPELVNKPNVMTWHPLESGTASALYFGQRLYQFPLGVFGVALGTVIFPLLSRHAQAGEWDRLKEDLTYGLRLVVVVGIPASAGLILLAKPLASLFFEHGAFDSEDAWQTSRMIVGYGLGVWAYCGLLILYRGFYAMGDQLTPLKIGTVSVVINLMLNLTLIWWIGGMGLALSTSISATVEIGVAFWLMQRRISSLPIRVLGSTILRTMIATALMVAVGVAMLSWSYASSHGRVITAVLPLVSSALIFIGAAWMLKLDEFWSLMALGRKRKDD